MEDKKAREKYCPRLLCQCQYRRTEYCPMGNTQFLPIAPECKKLAHRAVELSMENGE